MRRPLLPAAIALLAFVPLARATPPPAAPLRAQVAVELRSAHVVVLGPDGRPVAGLAAADFRVRDGVAACEVASVEEHRAAPPGSSGSAPAADAARIAARRWVVLFDGLHPGPAENLARAREDLKRFVRERLGPDDQLAVLYVGTGGIRASGFHSRPEAIAAEIDGVTLRAGDLPGAAADEDPVRRIEEDGRLPEGSGVAAAELQASRRAASSDPMNPASPQNSARATTLDRNRWTPIGGPRFAGTADIERRVFNVRDLEVMENLVTGLQSMPGRKILILLSAGFHASDLHRDKVIETRFTRALEKLMDSSTTVYSIDTNGMASPVNDTVFEASVSFLRYSSPVKAESGLSLERLRSVSNDFFDRQGGAFLLAHETGGLFLSGMNSFDRHLGTIAERETSSYLVRWPAPPGARPGEFRDLDIDVARPGHKVIGPRGYLVEKLWEKMSAAEREADLITFAERGAEREDWPGAVRADVFPDGSGGSLAVVSLLTAPGALARGKGREAGQLDLVFAPRHVRGGLARLERSFLPLDAVPGGDWHLEHGLPLPEGTRGLSFVARDSRAGKVLARRLEAAPLPARGLTRPVRIAQVAPVERTPHGVLPRDPFDFGGIRLTPAGEARLAAGERLYLLYEAFGLSDTEVPAPRYLLIAGGTERALEADAVREKRVADARHGIASILARIPTEGLAAGRHQLAAELDGQRAVYEFEIAGP